MSTLSSADMVSTVVFYHRANHGQYEVFDAVRDLFIAASRHQAGDTTLSERRA
jgi:hypothetical protein